MPTPTPTNEDINFVREVAGELDFDFVSSLIDELNDDQWLRALDLVDLWNETEAGGVIGLKGGRDGVVISIHEDGLDDSLRDIRMRMRLLLGLPELRDASITGGAASMGVATEWRW